LDSFAIVLPNLIHTNDHKLGSQPFSFQTHPGPSGPSLQAVNRAESQGKNQLPGGKSSEVPQVLTVDMAIT
jgi:hypothetical protein